MYKFPIYYIEKEKGRFMYDALHFVFWIVVSVNSNKFTLKICYQNKLLRNRSANASFSLEVASGLERYEIQEALNKVIETYQCNTIEQLQTIFKDNPSILYSIECLVNCCDV